MLRLEQAVRTIVEPLTEGRYLSDWQARAAQAGAISDYYTIRARDNPLFELDDDQLGARFGSVAVIRQEMEASFQRAVSSTRISYAFPMSELGREERPLFERYYGYVDSVEKMAMSAVAYAICRFRPSRSQLLLLCNQFYEEGLHLNSLSTLLGIDQAKQPWIAPKREPFWRFAREASSLAEYVLFQNCLSEGEGAIAAAEIMYALRTEHAGPMALAVANRITAEETSHALLGYTILNQLDRQLTAEDFQLALDRYRTVEIVRAEDTAKGRRQRFAMELLGCYISSRSVASVEALLVRAVDQCRRTGTWDVLPQASPIGVA
jgi:hypothetical protein